MNTLFYGNTRLVHKAIAEASVNLIYLDRPYNSAAPNTVVGV